MFLKKMISLMQQQDNMDQNLKMFWQPYIPRGCLNEIDSAMLLKEVRDLQNKNFKVYWIE